MATIQRLTPMLQVHDLQATAAFWRDTLGFTVDAMWPEETPTWCMMRAGEAEIMFTYGASGAPALGGGIYVYPDDVRALWERIKDSVDVVDALAVMEYGMREFSVRDPNGFTVYIGEPAPGETPDHQHEHPHPHDGEHGHTH